MGVVAAWPWVLPIVNVMAFLTKVTCPVTKDAWLSYQAALGCTEQVSHASWERFVRCDFYTSEEYLVQVDSQPVHEFRRASVLQLWVSRHDGGHTRSRGDLMRIKNEIVGEEFEAIELFPAEHRVNDAANRTSLFVFLELNGTRAPRYPAGPSERGVGVLGQH